MHWAHYWKYTVNITVLIHSSTERTEKQNIREAVGTTLLIVRILCVKEPQKCMLVKRPLDCNFINFQQNMATGSRRASLNTKQQERARSPIRRHVVCYALPYCFISKGEKIIIIPLVFCVPMEIKHTKTSATLSKKPWVCISFISKI